MSSLSETQFGHVSQKWRDRVLAVRAAMPEVVDERSGPASPADSGRVIRAIAHSEVPTGDMAGLSRVRVRDTRSVDASYSPLTRGLTVSQRLLRSTDPAGRGQLQRSLAHEIGHHVSDIQEGPEGEALAENYADKHGGSFLGDKGTSKYDRMADMGFFPDRWGEDGRSSEERIAAYQEVRKTGRKS